MLIDYDKHSLIIDGQKTLIRSAAIHYFRMPGESIWRDRLSKLKACGYNTIDVYFCWGYHSSAPGKYDFTGVKDIRKLLDIATELGLFVIARPGPYINAELSLGGLPKWLLNKKDIVLRNRKDGDFVYCEIFMKYLKEWYSRIIPIINEYHNIIAFQVENEYFTNEAEPDYIQELYDIARSMGIKAPIFHNDVLNAGIYSDIVDIYAFDNYPTINMKYDWRDFPDTFGVLDHAEENLGDASPDAPLFVAELQGGWYDKWLGPGYKHIKELFGREHINIVTKTVLSQGITMYNHYMGCGGTSWGQLASSEVYTSYDFASPVSEEGFPEESYYKSKEINYFLNAFNLASTDLVATDSDVTSTEAENTLVRLRKDNINNCEWLFLRNLNKESLEFELKESNKASIKPYDMKVLPVNLALKACNVDFSGMSIFGKIEDENQETLLVLIEDKNYIKLSGFDKFEPDFEQTIDGSCVTINGSVLNDFDTCEMSKGGKSTKFIFITQETADKTWIVNNQIIIGPEFLTDNDKKAAFSQDTQVKIISLKSEKIKNITVPNESHVPTLSGWKRFTAGPEIDMAYDCSSWNFLREGKFDSITNEIYDDYIWYKGLFKGHINEIEINAKHCFGIYINGKQVFFHDGLIFAEGSEVPEKISLCVDKKVLNDKGPNEITVLTQNLGFDRGFQNELLVPRGILSFKTLPEKEIEWQIRAGLTPIIEEWTESPSKNLESISDNCFIKLLHSTFEHEKNTEIFNPLMVDLSKAPFDKADIFLNGKMIGRYWKDKSPQNLFYIPDDFIENKNILALVIWSIKPESCMDMDYKNPNKYVKIKIRNIKSFATYLISEFK